MAVTRWGWVPNSVFFSLIGTPFENAPGEAIAIMFMSVYGVSFYCPSLKSVAAPPRENYKWRRRWCRLPWHCSASVRICCWIGTQSRGGCASISIYRWFGRLRRPVPEQGHLPLGCRLFLGIPVRIAVCPDVSSVHPKHASGFGVDLAPSSGQRLSICPPRNNRGRCSFGNVGRNVRWSIDLRHLVLRTFLECRVHRLECWRYLHSQPMFSVGDGVTRDVSSMNADCTFWWVVFWALQRRSMGRCWWWWAKPYLRCLNFLAIHSGMDRRDAKYLLNSGWCIHQRQISGRFLTGSLRIQYLQTIVQTNQGIHLSTQFVYLWTPVFLCSEPFWQVWSSKHGQSCCAPPLLHQKSLYEGAAPSCVVGLMDGIGNSYQHISYWV